MNTTKKAILWAMGVSITSIIGIIVHSGAGIVSFASSAEERVMEIEERVEAQEDVDDEYALQLVQHQYELESIQKVNDMRQDFYMQQQQVLVELVNKVSSNE